VKKFIKQSFIKFFIKRYLCILVTMKMLIKFDCKFLSTLIFINFFVNILFIQSKDHSQKGNFYQKTANFNDFLINYFIMKIIII
jgi:hypothetical protein